MNLKEDGLEELFRNQFEQFEAPVPDAIWSNISSQLASSQATVAAAAGSKILATAGVALVTGLVGAAITFGVMSDKQPEIAKQEKVVIVSPINQGITENEIISEDKIAVEEITRIKEDIAVDEKQYKVVSLGKTQSGNPSHRQQSAMDGWVSPKKYKMNDVITNPESKSNIHQMTIGEETVIVEEVERKEVVAAIAVSPVGGYAPLKVYFSSKNYSKATANWEFGDGVQSSGFDAEHIFTEAGTYTVELVVIDVNGKEKRDFKTIEVKEASAIIRYPDVFTPNGDGANDNFAITGRNIADFQLSVFDMNGNLLFQSTRIDEGWNGMDKYGREIQAGSYFYTVNAVGVDGKIYKHSGQVALQR